MNEGGERETKGRTTGRLPKGWTWTTLREIADLKGGLTKGQKRSPDTVLQAVPYLRVANVQRGFLDLNEVKTIEATEQDLNDLRLQPGDVLFNEGGDRDKLGRGWIWRGEIPDCVHQNHVFRARLGASDLEPKFLSWYGNSAGQAYFWDEGKHTTNLASINLSKLGSLPIPLPPGAEQRRIVAEIEKQFSRLDAAVAALKRVQANLKRYRASVLQAACAGRLVPTEAEVAAAKGATFEPGQALLQRIEGEKLAAGGRGAKTVAIPARRDTTGLPNGWEWATVEQLNAVGRPCAYGVLQPGPDIPDGITLIRVGDINNGRIYHEDLKHIDPAIANPYPRTRLQGGEVLITLVGAIGRTAVVPPTLAGANTARAVGVIPLTQLIRPTWVEIWLRHPAKQVEMVGKAHEVARKTLNLEDVRAAEVALPPLAEQDRIISEVERLLSIADEVEAAVDANLKRAERLRQSILKRAFEGKLVPQDPADEPATVLLERIRAERAAAGGSKAARNGRGRKMGHMVNPEAENEP